MDTQCSSCHNLVQRVFALPPERKAQFAGAAQRMCLCAVADRSWIATAVSGPVARCGGAQGAGALAQLCRVQSHVYCRYAGAPPRRAAFVVQTPCEQHAKHKTTNTISGSCFCRMGWFSVIAFLALFSLLCRDRFDYVTSSAARSGAGHTGPFVLLLLVLQGRWVLFAFSTWAGVHGQLGTCSLRMDGGGRSLPSTVVMLRVFQHVRGHHAHPRQVSCPLSSGYWLAVGPFPFPPCCCLSMFWAHGGGGLHRTSLADGALLGTPSTVSTLAATMGAGTIATTTCTTRSSCLRLSFSQVASVFVSFVAAAQQVSCPQQRSAIMCTYSTHWACPSRSSTYVVMHELE
jgi:hypothetical protein